MIETRTYAHVPYNRGFIMQFETQVRCDYCDAVIVDWHRGQVLTYPSLPIPTFDYSTGEILVLHNECLCDDCRPGRVEALKKEGIRYENTDGGFEIIMPVPDDYEPPKPGWWTRLKEWWNG